MIDTKTIKSLMTGIEKKQENLSREEAAQLLKTTPLALEAFEKAYAGSNLETDDLFDVDASKIRSAMKQNQGTPSEQFKEEVDGLVERIVRELLSQTYVLSYGPSGLELTEPCEYHSAPVTAEEIGRLPESLRPQLAGNLAKRDLGGEPSYKALLYQWQLYRSGDSEEKRQMAYHIFRQGLDILDLDPVVYEMLGMNPDAIGYWFPALAQAARGQGFFRIPDTKILKVPLPMLQLTRLDYESLTQTSMRIMDEFCFRAFGLDEEKEYFVKTGTYSSKFDFRNAYVHRAKEVRELGEYLLYIQSQACIAAGPLSQPCVYGMSTTNEWCVREFIPDKENNPCIYKGMPLHTEYRVFVDFDADEILGICPYWDPETMKQRLGHEKDADSPHKIHDYTIFLMHEETLMKRYEENKGKVLENMKALVPLVDLPGQWSVDIMQNGDDFYLIDMALAVHSALNKCIPEGKMRKVEENWIPEIGEEDTYAETSV